MPKRKWDESKVSRDEGGRFQSNLSGSGYDKAQSLFARNQALGNQVYNSTAHRKAVGYVDQVGKNARSTSGYKRHQRGYAMIRAVGNAPLKTAKGKAHLAGHAGRNISNNRRSENAWGNNNRYINEIVHGVGMARATAAITNESRRTTKQQKTQAQRNYEAAAKRFQAKLRKAGY